MFRVEIQEDGSYLIVNRDDPSETYVWQPGKNLPDHVMQALIEYLSGTPEQEQQETGEDPFSEDPSEMSFQDRRRYMKGAKRYQGRTPGWVSGAGGGGRPGWTHMDFKRGGGFGDPTYLNAMYAQAAANNPERYGWFTGDYTGGGDPNYVPVEAPSTLADLTPEEEEALEYETMRQDQIDRIKQGEIGWSPSSDMMAPTSGHDAAKPGTMAYIMQIERRRRGEI